MNRPTEQELKTRFFPFLVEAGTWRYRLCQNYYEFACSFLFQIADERCLQKALDNLEQSMLWAIHGRA